jgi:hypothetical protein
MSARRRKLPSGGGWQTLRRALGFALRAAALVGGVAAVSCSFDKTDRWIVGRAITPQTETCSLDALRCTTALERCSDGPSGLEWTSVDDCAARGLVCSAQLQACATCEPNSQSCDGQTVLRCDEVGGSWSSVGECNPAVAEACRGGRCANLCTLAAEQRSNVGCEYWAVDLDNAVAGPTLNAAAQQFAVVISNPQPDLAATVHIEQDDTSPGQTGSPVEVALASVSPFNLVVFPLGPREVDGSPPGQYNTGTGTALTRAAYRITSDVPVVAYQFNPLQNVDVFSNDASLLKPVEALRGAPGAFEDAYVVLGWPQTISSTDDPSTNFGGDTPLDFRAFLTVVATRDETRVRVKSTAKVLGGGPVAGMSIGDSMEITLNAFDVLNLETDDFTGDFTGSLVASDRPVAVFSGSEASDSPRFDRLSERRCCADHLEEQLDPIRSAGKRFIVPVSFNRHLALSNAGAPLSLQPEEDVFRVIAVLPSGANVRTSLAGELGAFSLSERGVMREIVTSRDFWLESDAPVMVGNVTASQSAAGIPGDLPGGDPSFIIIPPVEQFRAEYVFLTPDRYSFDFLRIMAPRTATILLDTRSLDAIPGCQLERGTSLEQELDATAFGFRVYRCQLSFPIIDSTFGAEAPLQDGVQDDGVHRIRSDQPIGVLVDGFDRNVSYGYAAGTELREIVP